MNFRVLFRCVGDEGQYTVGSIVKALNVVDAVSTAYDVTERIERSDVECTRSEDNVLQIYAEAVGGDVMVGPILPPELHKFSDRFLPLQP